MLTRISYDHTGILGSTLREIAVNKAGIIKPRQPCVIAPQASPDVIDVFLRQAEAVKSPASLHGRDWETVLNSGDFEYKSERNSFRLPLPRCRGGTRSTMRAWRWPRWKTARTLFCFSKKYWSAPCRTYSGRGAWSASRRAPGGPAAGGMGTVAGRRAQRFRRRSPGGSGGSLGNGQALHLVTAMKNTKDVAGFYRPLLAHAATVQAVEAGWAESEMAPAEELCGKIRQMGYGQAKTAPNLESALRSLVFQFPNPQRILITGSLYLVGRALRGQS